MRDFLCLLFADKSALRSQFAYAYQNAITKKFEIERTTNKELMTLAHILRISVLLETIGSEADAPHLKTFVDSVCALALWKAFHCV